MILHPLAFMILFSGIGIFILGGYATSCQGNQQAVEVKDDIPGIYTLQGSEIQKTLILNDDGSAVAQQILSDDEESFAPVTGEWSFAKVGGSAWIELSNTCLYRHGDKCQNIRTPLLIYWFTLKGKRTILIDVDPDSGIYFKKTGQSTSRE